MACFDGKEGVERRKMNLEELETAAHKAHKDSTRLSYLFITVAASASPPPSVIHLIFFQFSRNSDRYHLLRELAMP